MLVDCDSGGLGDSGGENKGVKILKTKGAIDKKVNGFMTAVNPADIVEYCQSFYFAAPIGLFQVKWRTTVICIRTNIQ